jgi:hypothetical protein
MQKVIWITPALALLLLAPAVAQYPSVTVEARRWSPSLTGSAQAGDQTLGTFIDLESDLGLDPDDLLEGRLLVQLSRRNQLRLSYLKGGINGDATASRSFTFGDRDFTLSSRVVSSLDLEIARFAWVWQLFSSPQGKIKFGPLLEVRAIRGDARIGAPDLVVPISTTETFETGYVAAGLALDYKLGRMLQIFAESSNLVESAAGSITDAEYGIRITPMPKVEILVGQRRLEIDLEDDSDQLILDLDGTFFAVGFKF